MQARGALQYQRGAAIITALLVVMLAATIATYLLSQQSRALTRTARATERAQVTLYAEPTLNWARAALFASQNNSIYVALTQPWAQPIAAQPLVSPDGGAAVLASGLIHDEARTRLRNILRYCRGKQLQRSFNLVVSGVQNIRLENLKVKKAQIHYIRSTKMKVFGLLKVLK